MEYPEDYSHERFYGITPEKRYVSMGYQGRSPWLVGACINFETPNLVTPLRHILTFRLDASALGRSGAQVRNEYTTIMESVRRQPGVHGIAYAAEGLISGG